MFPTTKAAIVVHERTATVRFWTGVEERLLSKQLIPARNELFSVLARHLLYIYTTNLWGMKGTYLGEFEEVVLLAVAIRAGDAYGAAVVNEIEQQMGRSVNLGAVHSALNRLQEKGLVSSEMGGMTAERGGRRKRLYSVTAYGRRALDEIRQLRNQMWDMIPKTAWGQLNVQ